MARRPRQWWWRSCQAKAPENIPRRPAIRVSRLGTKPAHVPVHHSRHEASDDLLPALLGDRLGLGLAHGWSRLRHRLGRNAIAGECRKDGIARRLTGCHLIGLLRRYGNGFHLWKAIRLHRWHRGYAFLLGGWLDSGDGSDASTAFCCAVFAASAIGGPARRDCHRLTHRGASTRRAYCSLTAFKNHGSDHEPIV